MVHFRTLDVRWIWRYRTFYIAGLAVMSIQIFLAVIFFTLYDETDKNSSNESYLKNTALFNQVNKSKLHSFTVGPFTFSHFVCFYYRKHITNTMYYQTTIRSRTNQKTQIYIRQLKIRIVP